MASIRDTSNQVPDLVGHDVVGGDAALSEAILRHGSPEVADSLVELGREAGTAEARAHGALANAHPPALRPYDRRGNRIDEVEFHPSWHWLMDRAVSHGLAARPWAEQRAGAAHAHLRRAAGFFAWSQVEPGHGCPISMTYAAVPALRTDPDIAECWEPLLSSTTYDPGVRDPATKLGALAGMGMTEKQGGSDVRTNVTSATPTPDAGWYSLRGHKWFTSAPMNDVFLVLAQAPDGLTCFVLPRVLPDGTRNAFDITRLKDKLGNRSNASGELEFDGTLALRLGSEGRGVRTIIDMVAATRLDCVIGSAALTRRAVAEATWHAAHRSAFGARLADQPAMSGVLADLAVESEAATALAMRLAAAVDRPDDEHEAALRRIALPLAKFWVCKRTPAAVAEAMECLGGNGYVEESGMPLLLRESPLNSIWEGSGNVNALDVLRALQHSGAALEAWMSEVGAARGADRRLDEAFAHTLEMLGELGDASSAAAQARRLAVAMATCLQGSLLVRHAPAEVSDAFCASRLPGSHGGVFGTLTTGGADRIVARATPIL